MTLMASSGICMALLVVRRLVLKEHGFGFLPWNLILAWIPLLFSVAFYSMHVQRSRRRVLFAACAVIWFLFYPNAPYLITDLVHLKQHHSHVPLWFDILMMMSLAWTGLFLGNLSLYLMQEVIQSWRGRLAGWIFSVSMVALGSLGVFVGRFWRWNSWEPLLHPTGLANKAAEHLGEMSILEAAAFSATFFAFTLLTYTFLCTFAHLHSAGGLHLAEEADDEEAPPEKAVAVWAGLR